MIDVNDSEEPRERSASHTRDASGVARATLLTDGGNEAENSGDDEAENGNGGDEAENGDETRILYLDVEGLFLDLLGLEVDLNEVVLDVSAVPGPGNLLGNLLSAVAGVLGGGLSDVLDGILPDDLLSGVLPDDLPDEMALDDRIPSLSDVAFGFVNILLDVILDALEDGESTDESSSDTQQS